MGEEQSLWGEGKDRNMGAKSTEVPEVDICGGWKPRQVCWFGECGWTDRHLIRLLSDQLYSSPRLWGRGELGLLLFAWAGYVSSCGGGGEE